MGAIPGADEENWRDSEDSLKAAVMAVLGVKKRCSAGEDSLPGGELKLRQ